MNSDTNFIPFTKSNWKWIIDLNIKCKAIRFFEDNKVKNPGDLGYGDNFLDTTPKAPSMKGITNKLDSLKWKNSALQKTTVLSQLYYILENAELWIQQKTSSFLGLVGKEQWMDNGHTMDMKLGQTSGDGEGQGGLVHWGLKDLDMTGRLNNKRNE